MTSPAVLKAVAATYRRRETISQGISPIVRGHHSEAHRFLKELNGLIDGDRYFLSDRIRTLKAIRAKIRPEPEREPPPAPPKHYAPPRASAARRRRTER
jgi:hypothetical protein